MYLGCLELSGSPFHVWGFSLALARPVGSLEKDLWVAIYFWGKKTTRYVSDVFSPFEVLPTGLSKNKAKSKNWRYSFFLGAMKSCWLRTENWRYQEHQKITSNRSAIHLEADPRAPPHLVCFGASRWKPPKSEWKSCGSYKHPRVQKKLDPVGRMFVIFCYGFLNQLFSQPVFRL